MNQQNGAYKVQCSIQGTAGILQHAFGATQLRSLQAMTKKGRDDYTYEWMDTMYIDSTGYLVQPATHIEGALIKAAVQFKWQGRKTYKDLMRAYVFCQPDEIRHIHNGEHVIGPDESLLEEPTENLSVSIMRVVVQRSAVARSRLLIAPGWQLDFTLDVIDNRIQPSKLQDILEEAGRAVGIGDFRPRYGRFVIRSFEVEE
jgi:hypothetical protein